MSGAPLEARRRPGGAGPASPCTGVCRVEPHSGYCAGCWRTLEEIAEWAGASDDARRAVLAAIERRRAAAEPVE